MLKTHKIAVIACPLPGPLLVSYTLSLSPGSLKTHLLSSKSGETEQSRGLAWANLTLSVFTLWLIDLACHGRTHIEMMADMPLQRAPPSHITDITHVSRFMLLSQVENQPSTLGFHSSRENPEAQTQKMGPEPHSARFTAWSDALMLKVPWETPGVRSAP